jgi:hypothetical protein
VAQALLPALLRGCPCSAQPRLECEPYTHPLPLLRNFKIVDPSRATVLFNHPFAWADLGRELLDWASQAGKNFEPFRSSLETLAATYGDLRDLEQILTDLDGVPSNERVAALTRSERAFIRQAVEHSIPGLFNCIRAKPAPLYDQMSRHRIREGDLVITFNYDVAIEHSLKREGLWHINDGYGFELGISGLPASKVKILKLHGSTNWWGPLFDGLRGFFQAGPNSLPSRPVVLFAHDFEFLGYPPGSRDPQYRGDSRPAVQTALIIPTRHKRFYLQTSFGREWEEFWKDLWNQAAQALNASEEIVIIGYSMPVADEDARQLLFQKPNKNSRITLLCGGRSKSICEEFKSHGFAHAAVSKSGRFEEFLAE